MSISRNNSPIQADSLRTCLTNQLIGRKIYAFQRVTSTNDLAKRLAERGEVEGALVIADCQTKGRGRFQRQWQSPPATGLWFSIILRPKFSVENLESIPFLAGISVAQAIETVTGLKPILKWPNDVLLASKKVCGILIESSFTQQKLNSLILGIGINVNQQPVDFNGEIRNRATSLLIEAGHSIDRKDLLLEILRFLELNYIALMKGEFNHAQEWAKSPGHR
jgi:BirA family biotin operon repressor/biotin-[acetyl-CoA-carboxylase] ligase